MISSLRGAPPVDSSRAGAAIADFDELVAPNDRASANLYAGLIVAAPGPALLVWGPEAICLAYNRSYRALSGLRVNAIGKPLFRAQPEIERPLRLKLDQAMTGAGVPLDAGMFEGLGAGQESGWLLPALGGDGVVRGAIALFVDLKTSIDPLRRLLGAVAADMRDPLVGIRVVSERLERTPKVTRERCEEDMQRIRDLVGKVEQLADDMNAYSRLAGVSGGARVAPQRADLGRIVRDVGEAWNAKGGRRIEVRTTEALGAWDVEALRRAAQALIASADRASPEGAPVKVDVVSSREGMMLIVKDNGLPLREDEVEQLFEPWRRASPSVERRRAGGGVALYLARELVHAHGGRLVCERVPPNGFVIRAIFPPSHHIPTPHPPPSSHHTTTAHASGQFRAVQIPGVDRRGSDKPIHGTSSSPPSFDRSDIEPPPTSTRRS